jgi:hypothetical protein
MSRGLGKTQRQILATIAAQPDEAWDVEALCRAIYPGDLKPSRSQLGATVRALKSMKLPSRWKFGYVGSDRRRWLYADIDSVAQRIWAMETFEFVYGAIGETTLILELSGGDTDDPAYVPVDQQKPTEPVD